MSNPKNFRQRYAIDKKNEERLHEVNPMLDNQSGIYFLTRTDENGIKYAYIGQAKHLLKRLVGHLSGYQHIDNSLRKYGLAIKGNLTGWNVNFLNYSEDRLDEMEQHWIKEYARRGYQLRNKTAGGQGEGKVQIDEYKPAKGYRDGIKQGRKNLARELKHIIDTHLIVALKPGKENNKVSQKAFERFNDLLNEGNNEE